MTILGPDGKPVYTPESMQRETFKRFLNICLHPVPAIAQKPLRKQLENWLASMTADQYNQFYLHVRSKDKRGLAVLAQQVIAVVRDAHMAPKDVAPNEESRGDVSIDG